jgi:hypothetical protein
MGFGAWRHKSPLLLLVKAAALGLGPCRGGSLD